MNRLIFEAFMSRRAEIEEAFGDPLQDRSAELAELDARAASLARTADVLAGQLVAAERDLPAVAPAIEHRHDAERRVAALRSLDEDLETTRALLERARDKTFADIAPVLNETLRPWISRITGDRYTDVRVDPESLGLMVREPSGQVRDADVLSHGTTEQLFVLLRLALAHHLGSADETAPLILDDITVQSDTERTRAMLDLLLELSRERQIVLFSQEDEVLEWAGERMVSDSDAIIALQR
jgi:DNA repair exonuclease SbcCD ATPase subunit